jgi:hypothetical protein
MEEGSPPEELHNQGGEGEGCMKEGVVVTGCARGGGVATGCGRGGAAEVVHSCMAVRLGSLQVRSDCNQWLHRNKA